MRITRSIGDHHELASESDRDRTAVRDCAGVRTAGPGASWTVDIARRPSLADSSVLAGPLCCVHRHRMAHRDPSLATAPRTNGRAAGVRAGRTDLVLERH